MQESRARKRPRKKEHMKQADAKPGSKKLWISITCLVDNKQLFKWDLLQYALLLLVLLACGITANSSTLCKGCLNSEPHNCTQILDTENSSKYILC
jgi:hypothetical protein